MTISASVIILTTIFIKFHIIQYLLTLCLAIATVQSTTRPYTVRPPKCTEGGGNLGQPLAASPHVLNFELNRIDRSEDSWLVVAKRCFLSFQISIFSFVNLQVVGGIESVISHT